MNLEPLNVLLADDDTDDCLFFDKALKALPISSHLTIVHDGEQLIKYLSDYSQKLPDVVFLDLSMPRKTGFECLSEIREIANLKDLHVVMFSTAYSHDMIYERDMINVLYSIGAQDYIRKPGDFEKLKQIVHEVLVRVAEKKRLNPQVENL